MATLKNDTQWPSPGDYDWALQNRKTTFYDRDIQDGVLQVRPTGPVRLNGGGSKYVCVYKIDDWVVRCFTAQPPNVQPPTGIVQRYQAITSYLQRSRHTLPFLVEHTWVEPGVHINGKDFPYLKIPYIKGSQPLGEFLSDHYGEEDFARAAHILAQQWRSIVQRLEEAQIAHGDLDMTNILVCGTLPTITLKLIDFDGMYVPDLASSGLRIADHGHAHFQPANAKLRTFGPTLDRFSDLIIYLSLCGLAKNPALWENCEADENRLLLGADDFKRLGMSHNLTRLRQQSDNRELQRCLDELLDSMSSNERMPRSLTDILGWPYVRKEEPDSKPLPPPPSPTIALGRTIPIPIIIPVRSGEQSNVQQPTGGTPPTTSQPIFQATGPTPPVTPARGSMKPTVIAAVILAIIIAILILAAILSQPHTTGLIISHPQMLQHAPFSEHTLAVLSLKSEFVGAPHG